jgi:RNA polymerase sigma-70 factor (ECF subfamily)
MPDIDHSMDHDESWFRSLHGRAAEDVARFALRRTRSAADADDVISETFLVAWRRRHVVPEPPEDLLWLYGVARNVLANAARGARRQERLWARLAAEPVTVAADPPSEPLADVACALAALPSADAELLRLLAWEGLTHGEAAVVLGTTENAVALRASRARRALRARLTDQALDRT